MVLPDGNLTPAQFEIMEIVWECGRRGATVADIWQGVSQSREVARTTVLNLVDRLERRGWLRRRKGKGANHFVAVLSREKTERLLAGGFVDDFFGGSASELLMSLLGSRRLKADEVERLRRMLEEKAETKPAAQRGRKGEEHGD